MDGLEFTYSPYGKDRHQVFAYDDGYAIGFIEWKDDGNVTLVYVTHGYRRMGVGTLLLDNAILTAKRKGIAQPSYSTNYTPLGSLLMLHYTGEYHNPTLDPDAKVKVEA